MNPFSALVNTGGGGITANPSAMQGGDSQLSGSGFGFGPITAGSIVSNPGAPQWMTYAALAAAAFAIWRAR